ncbi:MAG: hypothetical protein M1815_000188, partial [Lichina confinis]
MRAPPSAAAIAAAHFSRELQSHHSQASPAGVQADMVVILHDACYGHRYSRPRSSKTTLNSIVERPERLQAAALGVALAYVRLGERHSDGAFAPRHGQESHFSSHLPFRIHKSTRMLSLSSPVVISVHGSKWMDELKSMCEAAEAKLSTNGKELGRDPSPERTTGKPALHDGDLYLCGQSLEALEGALGAVCDGVDAIFQAKSPSHVPKRAFVGIRPPGHHCSADYPSGFCWLNNIHVGISYAASTHGLTHAAIIDFDLHHGDGSQEITWNHNAGLSSLPKRAPSSKRCAIGYFSLHDINSYPCEMGDEDKVQKASICVENAHGQNVWNVHLQPWRSEAEFWELYETRYRVVLEKARAFLRTQTRRLLATANQPKPKAAIFLSAGFDASEWEGAGMQRHKINVPTDFYARFTRDIVELAHEEDLAVDGRIISMLEGGYSDRALYSGVFSHLAGMATANRCSVPDEVVKVEDGLGYDMSKRIGTVERQDQQGAGKAAGQPSFDPEWWSPRQLDDLEALVRPVIAPPAARKPRRVTAPTFNAATQSSKAKVVSPPKPYRTVSGSGPIGCSNEASTPRPPSPQPPPPPVDWTIAAHELSKLLVPDDRPTRSYRVEELSTDAHRGRKVRHSSIGLPADPDPATTSKMILRDRRGRTPSYVVDNDDDDNKDRRSAASRAHRRRTVAAPILAVEEPSSRGSEAVAAAAAAAARAPSRPVRPGRRQSSAGSSVVAPSPHPLPPIINAAATAAARPKKVRSSTSRPTTASSVESRLHAAKARAAKATSPSTTATQTAPYVSDDSSSRVAGGAGASVVHAASMMMKQALTDTLSSSAADDAGTRTGGEEGEIDRLTEGLVRIKLNVPSRDEYEARRSVAD